MIFKKHEQDERFLYNKSKWMRHLILLFDIYFGYKYNGETDFRIMNFLSSMVILSGFLLFSTWLAASVLAFFFFLKGFRRRHLNLPPGPKPWPIIGNLNLISPLPHVSLHELSKKYGSIMHLQFGALPVVVGSSVEMAKEFLKVHDQKFANRPRSTAGKYTSYDHSDLAYSPYGPYFVHIRKICLVELFSAKRLDTYQHIRVEESRAFLSDIYASCGEPITLKDCFSLLTLNNITRMTLGKKYLNDSESVAFRRTVDEWEELNGVMNIGDLIPWINFLDLQGLVKRIKAVGIEMDRFLESVLEEHIAKRQAKSFTPKDMLDVLLEVADDPNPELKLTRDKIKGLTWNLLAGGTATSTTAIEWAMSEVMKEPKIIKKAREELDRVIGSNRWVAEEDAQNLPYIRCIILESLRLHPVAPMLVPHFASQDCKIDGYDIVQGTQVLVNIWSIARDPAVWDSPYEFNPDRFLGRDIDVKGQHFELLPFGTGRRMCPAYNLGMKLIETSLANLLLGFNWKLPDQMKPQDLNMEEVFGLTLPRKIPLVIVPEARLPSHVYSL